MPAALTYPGVYVEEIPSGVRTIIGVATSITAFIGTALRGPTDSDAESPVTINSYGDYERIFGGLWSASPMSYAVRDFFLNGGSQAIIVRLFDADDSQGASPPKTQLKIDDLTFEAVSPGSWGTSLRGAIDKNVSEEAAKKLNLTADQVFNLTIRDVSPN